MACDYAINPLLVDAGLTLPPSALLDDRFRSMSAEQIYSLLARERDESAAGSGRRTHRLEEARSREINNPILPVPSKAARRPRRRPAASAKCSMLPIWTSRAHRRRPISSASRSESGGWPCSRRTRQRRWPANARWDWIALWSNPKKRQPTGRKRCAGAIPKRSRPITPGRGESPFHWRRRVSARHPERRRGRTGDRG